MPLVNAGLSRRERGRTPPPASTAAQSGIRERMPVGRPMPRPWLPSEPPAAPRGCSAPASQGTPNPGSWSWRYRGDAARTGRSPEPCRKEVPTHPPAALPPVRRSAVREEPGWQPGPGAARDHVFPHQPANPTGFRSPTPSPPRKQVGQQLAQGTSPRPGIPRMGLATGTAHAKARMK